MSSYTVKAVLSSYDDRAALGEAPPPADADHDARRPVEPGGLRIDIGFPAETRPGGNDVDDLV
jgi:hypothetical protein